MFWSAFCLNDSKDTASCDSVELVEEANVKKKKRGKKGVIKRGMFSVCVCKSKVLVVVVLFVIRNVFGFECFEGGVKTET